MTVSVMCDISWGYGAHCLTAKCLQQSWAQGTTQCPRDQRDTSLPMVPECCCVSLSVGSLQFAIALATQTTLVMTVCFCKEAVVQHSWVQARSMHTKLAHVTLPVAPRHEVPMKKCHCSSSHQSSGTSPVPGAGQNTGMPAWLRGQCRGEGAPLLPSGARSRALQRFFLPSTISSVCRKPL